MTQIVSYPPKEKGVGWIYIFYAECIAKIGASVNVTVRLQKLKRSRPFGVEFYCAYAVPVELYEHIESRIHFRLDKRKIGHEWFLVSPDVAEKAIVDTLTVEFKLPLHRLPK